MIEGGAVETICCCATNSPSPQAAQRPVKTSRLPQVGQRLPLRPRIRLPTVVMTPPSVTIVITMVIPPGVPADAPEEQP